jgi:hypothetical protein
MRSEERADPHRPFRSRPAKPKNALSIHGLSYNSVTAGAIQRCSECRSARREPYPSDGSARGPTPGQRISYFSVTAGAVRHRKSSPCVSGPLQMLTTAYRANNRHQPELQARWNAETGDFGGGFMDNLPLLGSLSLLMVIIAKVRTFLSRRFEHGGPFRSHGPLVWGFLQRCSAGLGCLAECV